MRSALRPPAPLHGGQSPLSRSSLPAARGSAPAPHSSAAGDAWQRGAVLRPPCAAGCKRGERGRGAPAGRCRRGARRRSDAKAARARVAAPARGRAVGRGDGARLALALSAARRPLAESLAGLGARPGPCTRGLSGEPLLEPYLARPGRARTQPAAAADRAFNACLFGPFCVPDHVPAAGARAPHATIVLPTSSSSATRPCMERGVTGLQLWHPPAAPAGAEAAQPCTSAPAAGPLCSASAACAAPPARAARPTAAASAPPLRPSAQPQHSAMGSSAQWPARLPAALAGPAPAGYLGAVGVTAVRHGPPAGAAASCNVSAPMLPPRAFPLPGAGAPRDVPAPPPPPRALPLPSAGRPAPDSVSAPVLPPVVYALPGAGRRRSGRRRGRAAAPRAPPRP